MSGDRIANVESVSLLNRKRRAFERRVASFALVLACSQAAPAFAAEPTKAEIAVARRYFDLATKAESERRWRDAADLLDKAISIKETAGLRYHLGFARENLGQLVEALLEYQRASGLIHSGITTEDIERFVGPKLQEMQKRVPTLTVQVPPDILNPTFAIDGSVMKRELVGTPIPLNPGTHSLVIFGPGRRPFHAQISLGEGATVTQVAELVPEPLAPVGTPSATASASRVAESGTAGAWSTPRTWTLIGEAALTAAGLGIGLGYTLASHSAANSAADAQERIDANTPCDAASGSAPRSECDLLAAAATDHYRYRNIAVAGFVGAAIGAAAFATTWVVWKPSPKGGPAALIPSAAVSTRGATFTWKY